jgi:hypothetical protein
MNPLFRRRDRGLTVFTVFSLMTFLIRLVSMITQQNLLSPVKNPKVVEFPRGDQLAALSRGVLIRRRWLKLNKLICLEPGYAYLTAVRLFYTKIAGRQHG